MSVMTAVFSCLTLPSRSTCMERRGGVVSYRRVCRQRATVEGRYFSAAHTATGYCAGRASSNMRRW